LAGEHISPLADTVQHLFSYFRRKMRKITKRTLIVFEIVIQIFRDFWGTHNFAV
jgi:hypothetical protein